MQRRQTPEEAAQEYANECEREGGSTSSQEGGGGDRRNERLPNPAQVLSKEITSFFSRSGRFNKKAFDATRLSTQGEDCVCLYFRGMATYPDFPAAATLRFQWINPEGLDVSVLDANGNLLLDIMSKPAHVPDYRTWCRTVLGKLQPTPTARSLLRRVDDMIAAL